MRGSGISVIIPVLHESDMINDLIDHIRSLEWGKDVEIIVVDGSKERDTIGSIRRTGVRKLLSPKGRGIQMNRGARASRGDIVVFLHADTILPNDAFHLIHETLNDRSIMAGAFTMRFDEAPLHMRIMNPVHDLRGRITRIPFGDQVFFMGKEAFERTGGFRDIKVLEDMDLMLRMRRSGMKIKILDQKVITSSRRFLERGPIKNLVVNLYIITAFHMGADPDKLARFYEK